MYDELVKQLRHPWQYNGLIADLTNSAADAIKELSRAAKAMHTWIFLNSVDEQAAYDECGLTAEMNAVLGYGGQFVMEPPKEEKLKGEKSMDRELIDRIDRMERQMLNNQLVIMGALDDLIMHGGGNQWAKVHPALTALHDGMASTSAILEQSAEPPKEEV